MNRIIHFPPSCSRPVPEFLKRDRAGATKRLLELMQAPEWKQFPWRMEFKDALCEALGIEGIEIPPPEAA